MLCSVVEMRNKSTGVDAEIMAKTRNKVGFDWIIVLGAFELQIKTFQPPHDKTNKMVCVPSEDSDQPGHPPSLIRYFAVHSMGS